MNYIFKYKKDSIFSFWKSIDVTGHVYDHQQDKMTVYTSKSAIFQIPSWKNYYLKLGADWMRVQEALAAKKKAAAISEDEYN